MIEIKIPFWLAKAKKLQNNSNGKIYTTFHTIEENIKETEKAYIFSEIHSYGMHQRIFFDVIFPKSLVEIINKN